MPRLLKREIAIVTLDDLVVFRACAAYEGSHTHVAALAEQLWEVTATPPISPIWI